MKLEFTHHQQRYSADTTQATSLAIPLQFDGPQPNYFGTDPAVRQTLRLGDFIGDTKIGGSCNVDHLRLIPHCNGTHTETVSHIINEHIYVGHAATETLSVAALITVPCRRSTESDESYRPNLEVMDLLITARDLQRQLQPWISISPQALIIRTLPNTPDKQTRQYAEGPQPAFFTIHAMQHIDSTNCQHLLVDLPSVDRMYDDGLLTCHHLFWHVPEGSHTLTPETRQERTITEMVFVPDQLQDGLYLLNLQIPSFATDAAPSRPVIMPLKKR